MQAFETTKQEAEISAKKHADLNGIPQTIYTNKTTCGWWHTHAHARLLKSSNQYLTVLPANYFIN